MQRLLIAALFLTAAGATLNAQSAFMTADIPFDFHAGETTIPAGLYVFESKAGMLLIQHQTSHKNICMLVTNLTVARNEIHAPSVAFTRYGDDYFLSKIWSGSSWEGRELPRTSLEKEVARNSGQATKRILLARTK